MTGWRLGWAVGNEKLVSGLGKVKTNVDSGQFGAIQDAGIAALNMPEEEVEKLRNVYRERKRIMTEALQKIGLEVYRSDYTFYLWVKVPEGFTSAEFVGRLIDELGVVCTPGNGFGEHGEGYFRISLTRPRDSLRRPRG